MTLVQTPPKKIYMWVDIPPELCFTANTAGSTIQLTKVGNPSSVTLETSTNGSTWTSYTIGDTITLSNIGDKVYLRNTSVETTPFSSTSAYYKFVMTGSISGSGDVTSLINRNCTTDPYYSYSFQYLFSGCTSLTTPPSLGLVTISLRCCRSMFSGCTGLIALPKLYATYYSTGACAEMFSGCTNIKLSTTQTGSYQTAYRIPTEGTGEIQASSALEYMFYNTGGTFTGTPNINTTYYTSNTVV